MATIEDLPDELLIHIMSFLNRSHRQRAQQVNLRWNQLCCLPTFEKNEMPRLLNDEIESLDLNRSYPNVTIKVTAKDVPNPKTSLFWKKCGKHIETLSMLFELGERVQCPEDIICHTPNLKHLYWVAIAPVTIPNSLYFNLPHLRSLQFISFHDGNLKHFLKNAPALETLTFNSQTKVGPVKELKRFLKQQRLILKDLHLEIPLWTDSQLKLVIDHCGPQLRGLAIKSPLLTDKSLLMVQEKLPNLKEIDLKRTKFTKLRLHDFVKNLKNLTTISLSSCEFYPRTATLILSMTQLRKLDLSFTRMSSHNLIVAIGSQPLPKLTTLYLSGLPVTEEVMKKIVVQMPNLEDLFLGYCQDLSDDSLRILVKSCTKLLTLSMENCSALTDVSCVNRLKGLRFLNISNCQNIIPASFVQLCLVDLQTLFFGGTQMSMMALQLVKTKFPSLYETDKYN